MKNFYGYEELGITVVRKLNKKKVAVVVSLIVIFFMLIAVLIHVLHINRKMIELEEQHFIENNPKEDTTQQQENTFQEEQIESVLEKEQTEEENNNEVKIPQYTEIAKQNIKNIYKSEEKVAYLTFDDGPSTNITPQILTVLDNYNIKATFFLLGVNAERYPNLVNEEYIKGHYIANHGYSHVYSSIYSSADAVIDEYNHTEQSIKNALNIQEYSSHLFRFPGGSSGTKYKDIKNEAKNILEANDVAYIDWNALTNDSVGTPTEESIMQNLVDTTANKNSVIILMHDSSTKQLTVDKLPDVIEYLQQQGYSFKNFYDIME